MSDQMKPAIARVSRIEYDVLRKKWSRLKTTGEEVLFEDLEDFLDWCMETGWDYGLKLIRIIRDGPFSRENCAWEEMKGNTQELAEMARKWEEGVGPIRKKLRPYLQAQAKQPKEKETMVFRYEHPDLVREGIVFEGSRSV